MCSQKNSEMVIYYSTYPQVPGAFFYAFLANFVMRTTSIIFLLARNAESQEKKASGQDHWDPHFHVISF